MPFLCRFGFNLAVWVFTLRFRYFVSPLLTLSTMAAPLRWPIKYSPAAVPGQKRKFTEGGGSVGKKKNYEEQRKDRCFNPIWKMGRGWLQFDELSGVMTCSSCIGVYGQGVATTNHKHAFISGCKNLRVSSINDHEKTAMHQDAIAKEKATKDPGASIAHKALVSLAEKNRKAYELKVRNIHAVVKSNRPLSDFVWLNKLDEAKGLSHGNGMYNNCMSSSRFLEVIAQVEKDVTNNLLTELSFFSLTMDGSTDISSTEQETIYLRYVIKGQVYHRFLCIGEPESTSSSDLHKFVMMKLEECGVLQHMARCTGFGSDGASNMTGVKNGLVTILKRDYSEIVGFHCLAHRLELSFKDAIKGQKSFEKLSTLLLGLYYFYKNSSKQKKELKRTFKVRNVSNFKLPKSVLNGCVIECFCDVMYVA